MMIITSEILESGIKLSNENPNSEPLPVKGAFHAIQVKFSQLTSVEVKIRLANHQSLLNEEGSTLDSATKTISTTDSEGWGIETLGFRYFKIFTSSVDDYEGVFYV